MKAKPKPTAKMNKPTSIKNPKTDQNIDYQFLTKNKTPKTTKTPIKSRVPR